MSSIPRFVLRWGLISALALGGATLLIGPERVAAGLSCVRAKAQSVVDRAVDSPVALRLLVALAGYLYAIPYVMMQIKAGGEISAVLFKGTEVSLGPLGTFDAFQTGAVVLAAITMVYIMIGGMRSVAWTDVLQGCLLIVGMLLGGLAVVSAFLASR